MVRATEPAPQEVAVLLGVLDAMPVGVLLWVLRDSHDPAGLALEFANQVSRDVLGLPAASVGATLDELFPTLYAAGLEDVGLGALASGTPLDLGVMAFGDDRVRRSDFDVSVHPLGTRHVLVVLQRLVPVKSGVREALRATGTAEEGALTCNLDGTVVDWTPSAEQVFEVAPQAALLRPLTQVLRPELPEQIVDAFRLVRSGVHSHHLRSRQLRGSGEQIDVEMTFTPVHSATGEVAGITVAVRDLTAVARLRETLEFVLEAARLGYWDLDLASDRTARSLTHDQLFGHDELQPEWNVAILLAHVHPEDRERVAKGLEEALHGDGEHEVEFRAVWPDGSVHWLASRGRVVRGADAQPYRVVGVIGDVTVRKHAELTAVEAAHRFAGLVDSMGDAVIGSTLGGLTTSWNRSAERLFGWTQGEMIGQPLVQLEPEERRGEARALLEAVAHGKTLSDVETQRLHRDGTPIDVALTLSPLRDNREEVVAVTTIVRDITDRRRLEADLRHQALHDPLTGLANRALLDDRLAHALDAAARSALPVSALVIDLDNFKIVNDAAGHALGDQVLIETARRLRAALRPEDSIARFGGDEFVVICEATDEAEAVVVADRLQTALKPPMEVEGRRLVVTASVGIATTPPVSADVLLRSADTALYDAKASGRARFSTFGPSMAQRADARLELSLEVREAIEGDRLALHYQPIVDLSSGRLLGVEALVRWSHPRRGAIPAQEFVGIAEDNQLIAELDRWVVRRACRDGAAMAASGLLGPTGYVAVNVGARDISPEGIGATVVEAVAAAGPGFGYGQLIVEVTETAVMADLGKAQRTLRDLSDLGVLTALDDFGTGYSSLTYLQRLPIAVLKIDRSFVQRIAEEPENLAIASSIVDLSAAMGIRTVAEGVETTEQMVLLQGMRCVAAQGWLWSAARSLPDITEVVLTLPEHRFSVA